MLKDDRLLSIGIVLIDVFAVLFAGICIAVGIFCVAFAGGAIGVLSGVFIMIFGIIGAWVSWVFGKLYMALLTDVKLVRNKLYANGNDRFKTLMTESRQEDNVGELTAKGNTLSREKLIAQLKELKELMNDGIITEEEFAEEKSKIFGKDIRHIQS